MDNNQNTPKKCFCARCFLPIEENEKVEVDGQNFHRQCGTCCICRCIPSKLKMFHGHVFCEECFKTFVLARLRGENPQVHVNSWWMQFAPGVKAEGGKTDDTKDAPKPTMPESKSCPEGPQNSGPSPEAKPCMCARCLQAVEDADKVEIGGQTFHCNCARCCVCHQVPKDSIKFYFGQVFCEECFNRHIMSRNRDNPTEFFNSCFEQWKNNAQFAESMKAFMESSGVSSPLVFMAPPSSFRVDAEREAGMQSAESKSATTATLEDSNTWDHLSIENRTEVSCAESHASSAAAEKIEKLTKYIRKTSSFNMETPKKWKMIQDSLESIDRVKLQRSSVPSKLTCPKCLWQFGTIVVDRDS